MRRGSVARLDLAKWSQNKGYKTVVYSNLGCRKEEEEDS
jgi:hypothetical protein